MILLMPWKTSGMLAFLRYAYYLFEEKTIAVMTKFFFTLKLMRRAQVVEVSRYWWTSGRRMAHVLQNYVRILSDHKKSLFLRVVGIRRDSENCSCDCYYRDTFSQGLETTDENHLSFDCKSVALWPVFLPLKKMLSLKCVGVLFVVGILFIGESQATILRNIVIGK